MARHPTLAKQTQLQGTGVGRKTSPFIIAIPWQSAGDTVTKAVSIYPNLKSKILGIICYSFTLHGMSLCCGSLFSVWFHHKEWTFYDLQLKCVFANLAEIPLGPLPAGVVSHTWVPYDELWVIQRGLQRVISSITPHIQQMEAM